MKNRVGGLPFRLSILKSLALAWQGSGWLNIVSVVISLLRSSVPLVIILLVKGLIDNVSELSMTGQSTGYGNMAWQVSGIALAFLVEEVSSSLSAYITKLQAARMSLFIQDKLHDKASQLDLIHFETSSFYDKLLRATREASVRPLSITSNLVSLFRGSASLIIMAILLVGFNWIIALALVLMTMPLLLLRRHYSNLLWQYRQQIATDERRSAYYSWILTGDRPARELRLFGTASYFRELFKESFSRVADGEVTLLRRRARTEIGMAIVKTAGLGIILWFMLARTIQGFLTMGELAMYLLAFRQGLVYVRELATAISGLHEDSLFVKDTYDFLDLPVTVKETTPGQALGQKGVIELEKVSFFYPDTISPAIGDLNLSIKKGESVAIVGSNGAGKSTLARIICGLYRPASGTVRYDGRDVATIDDTDYRNLFSVVFQDFMLYNMTLEDNISMGNIAKENKGESVVEAAELSGLKDLIGELPRGYQTVIGHLFDDSRELSWGEWQKIAIARALFRDAPVLILDEPTSALDANAEYEFYKRFREIRKEKTSILISHRLATVADADRIILLDKGMVAETGTHDELMSRKGIYFKMYSRQAGLYK